MRNLLHTITGIAVVSMYLIEVNAEDSCWPSTTISLVIFLSLRACRVWRMS